LEEGAHFLAVGVVVGGARLGPGAGFDFSGYGEDGIRDW
jgi:hypothetical protein